MTPTGTPDTEPQPLAPGAERGFRAGLWAILAAGGVLALVIAHVTRGDPFDMESFRLVRRALDAGPLEVYSGFARAGTPRWPYPPAFFPLVFSAGRLAGGSLPFEFLIRVPSIAADLALAWVVQDYLGLRRSTARVRLGAAALIALGPSFLAISGYHGQFDALAILPAALALRLWDRDGPWPRAIVCGLLIGLGAALKTVPGLFLLALLPSARSQREGGTLVAAAATPVLIALAPYALSGGLPPLRTFAYHGLPGAGGLSLAVQPDISLAVLGIRAVPFSGLFETLARHGTVVIVAGLAAVAAVGLRWRPPARLMAVLLWIGVYAFGVNFFFQYLLWGIPFFLMAGYVREVAAVQAVLVLPTVVFYLRPWHRPIVAVVYAGSMMLLWAVSCGAFALLARRLAAAEGRWVDIVRP